MKESANSLAQSFKSLPGISSGPVALCSLMLRSNLRTPDLETEMSGMLGKEVGEEGEGGTVGTLSPPVLDRGGLEEGEGGDAGMVRSACPGKEGVENTEENWELKRSALDKGSWMSLLPWRRSEMPEWSWFLLLM